MTQSLYGDLPRGFSKGSSVGPAAALDPASGIPSASICLAVSRLSIPEALSRRVPMGTGWTVGGVSVISRRAARYRAPSISQSRWGPARASALVGYHGGPVSHGGLSIPGKCHTESLWGLYGPPRTLETTAGRTRGSIPRGQYRPIKSPLDDETSRPPAEDPGRLAKWAWLGRPPFEKMASRQGRLAGVGACRFLLKGVLFLQK
ncbi:hypothetical protein M885DRAFT_135876 [Pelagophyceae sp. CCMP2097]|nr:hypothetical protein M885DRAFT_135876 [Pelagophyceae sp. CCMP2097]|mmetsp:Transcript_24872/g.85873  ORF Transcript_24872/g.85873 Transcript_24872/m.85873 type:complete len:204 (-) Transcript_24872:20-631(-)